MNLSQAIKQMDDADRAELADLILNNPYRQEKSTDQELEHIKQMQLFASNVYIACDMVSDSKDDWHLSKHQKHVYTLKKAQSASLP
jgi:hypothetical protein